MRIFPEYFENAANAVKDGVKNYNKEFKEQENLSMTERIKSKPGCVYSVIGARGKILDVYENKIVITVYGNIGSLVTGNFTDGEKSIYYKDAIGVQFKESKGLLLGYLQLETSSRMMNNMSSNFAGENSFSFEDSQNIIMNEVFKYIQQRIDEIKSGTSTTPTNNSTISVADELKKFKELLDMDIITQEEFDKKKKELLG